MAIIRPFKAIRPVRDKVHLVASMPHIFYKRNVLKAKLESNPYTFLNIIHPELRSKIVTAPNSSERFQQVRDKYQEFLDNGILVQDESPRLYLYRQTKNGHPFFGVIGGASVEEYKEDKIKKHEATLTSREAMFTNYLDIVGYNAEPVLLSYKGNKKINQLMLEKAKERPEYEYSTTDTVKHELWILDEKETKSMQKAFESIPAIYIADGHHRSASSAGLSALRTKRKEEHFPNESAFLAYFVEEENLKILEFNRLVRTLNGHTVDTLIAAIGKSFEVKKLARGRKPIEVGEITMFVGNTWYALKRKDEIVDLDHPVNSLDSEILTQFLLGPVLGITDLKSDDNIDFISGNFSATDIAKRIRKGDFSIGFLLYPISFEEVRKVADNQMIMPPKTTWVEPKLRSGLTIYHLNE